MSDAEFEENEEPVVELTPDNLKSVQDILDYLSEVIYDRWHNGLISPQASPWASANDFAHYITSFARSGMVDDNSLISALAEASGLDYNTFKRLWDRLPRDRKVSLLITVAYEVALGGFARFIENVVNTLKNYDDKARKQVAEAASKYLKGKMSYTDLMNRIASALWPTGASRNDSRYVDFLHGAELANYIPRFDVREHIKHILEGLKKHRWFW
ncbi:MAG: hypothetical protein RXO24_08985 [Acidilobus sp.]